MQTVAYYRRSTTLQENSLDMQRYKAFEAAVRHHLIIENEFTDDAISARKTNFNDREALQDVISLVKQGKIKNLLVFKRDRLSRNVVEHIKLYRILREHGINVVFTAEDELPMTYTSNGEMLEVFMGVMIQLEGQQINERIRAKNIANFRGGKDPGNLPYGYELDKESSFRYKRNEIQLRLIKDLYNKLYDGETLIDVSNYAKNKDQNRTWTTGYIRNLLQNPTYKGIRIRTFNGTDYDQEYKALKIISNEKWQKVYEMLEKTKIHKKKKEKLNLDYILEGLIVCTPCEESLYLGSQYRPFYRCNKCKGEISKNEIENKIMKDVLVFIQTLLESEYVSLIERYRVSSIANLEKQRTSIESKLFEYQQKAFTVIDDLIETNFENSSVLQSLYKKIKILKEDLNLISEETYKLNKLPQRLDHIRNYIRNNHLTVESSGLNSKYILNDVIKVIKVDKKNIDLVYKHPFTGLKEAHTIGY
ncbi:recombinase family protein [Anaerobacillus isosaccharinicus]|uniref:Recombinase family protein n=1 Tax=Anaerobacillus isosaccharinicus TaxID=1532552 RepID=A0A1S2M7D6_9BACI|nr:recombinase family protein [Anaerobacillus isosaccharinicus]MBA5585004.1 recombinase family protein [Anaerobacillus isosaccharinicus]QOY36643.1 recombinase family protein [Anaerobacillus isosaccharinicus]